MCIRDSSMCDPSHYVPLAKAAEEFGFRTFSIGDSICYPEEAEGDYPYLDSGDRTFLDGAPFICPFQLAASLATVTERLIFRTGVLKLPIRDPVLVAKQASLIDGSFLKYEGLLSVIATATQDRVERGERKRVELRKRACVPRVGPIRRIHVRRIRKLHALLLKQAFVLCVEVAREVEVHGEGRPDTA